MRLDTGLGQIEVGPLAKAILAGSINPQYANNTVQGPFGSQSIAPIYYMDEATAQQIAALLGGSVVQGLPSLDLGAVAVSSIPEANLIQLPGGGTPIVPGEILPEPGIGSDYPSSATINGQTVDPQLCEVELQLSDSIPGGEMDSGCQAWASAGNTGLLAPSTAAEVQSPGPGLVAQGAPTTQTYTPVAPVSIPATAVGPVLAVPPATAIQPPATSQVVSGTPGANVGGNAAGQVQSSQPPAASSCWNPLNAYVSDPCVGPVGMIELGLGVAILIGLFAMGGKR